MTERAALTFLLIDAAAATRAAFGAPLHAAGLLARADDLSVAASVPAALALLQALRHTVVLLNAASFGNGWVDLASALRACSPCSAIVITSDLPADDAALALSTGTVQDVLDLRRLGATELQRAIHFAVARQRALDPAPLAEAARLAKQRLRGVIDAVADALLIIDPCTGRCSDVNRAFERIFQLPAQTLLTQGLHCLESGRRMHSTAQLLQFIQSQVGHAAPLPAQWVFRCGEAGEVWCDVRASAIEGGRADEVLLSVHDTSARVVAEQSNKQAFAHSARAARVRRQFLANMSHEMRTPLNAILSFAKLGIEHQPPPPFDRYLGQVRGSAKLMLALVNDILDLSKIESGKLELTRTAFDVIQVVGDLADTVRPAEPGAVSLSVNIEPGLARYWVGDVLRVQQVLLNLLGNALKFTQRGHVDLGLQRWRDEQAAVCGIEFSVSDTGTGMSADELERVFKPFEQGDASLARRFGGTGLGLSISRSLVELMQGRITVHSTPGVGSRFEVRLPLPELTLSDSPAQTMTLRFVGLDDAARIACLLALGQHGWVADVLSPWVAAEADVVLIGVAGVRLQPGGLADALARTSPRSLVGLRGSADADGAVEHHSASQIVHVPTSDMDGFAALTDALRLRRLQHAESGLPAIAGLRVLMVEDNEVNQLIVREMLTGRGCQVTTVDDGAQAIALLVDGRVVIDLVLMDIQMPGMDGCEATRRLRQAGITLPIIALSAHVFDEDREAALAAGMDAYVTKPLDLADLLVAMVSIRARVAATAPQADRSGA